MRQTISGMVAAIAVMTASAVPAMACGGGLFQSSCSPCGDPCGQAQVYVAPAPVYSGCGTGCGGWTQERLPDPERQYYYANQGPTYSGPGNFAPEPTYQEGALPYYRHSYRYGYHARHFEGPGYGYHARHFQGPGYGYRSHYRPWRAHTGYYHAPRMNHHYGYATHHRYAPHYGSSARPFYAPRHYGHHEHVLRRYY